MAGDDVVMRTGAVMMIHDPASITFGDAADHEKTLAALETIANAIADIYAERTGSKPEEMRDAMKTETWLSARDAVKRGFADRTEKAKASEPTAFDYRLYQNAPERMVALAESRDWTIQAEQRADDPAVTQARKETSMADQKADGAANTSAEEKKVEDKVEAKAEVKTEAAETPEQITARVTAAERQRAKDIAAACALAGQPAKATAFIAEGKTLSETVASLQVAKVSGASAELNTHTGGSNADGPTWDKAIARQNARLGA
jgi:hypothetical protein